MEGEEDVFIVLQVALAEVVEGDNSRKTISLII